MINNTNIIDYTTSGSENANSLAAAATPTTIIMASEKHIPQTHHAAVILPQNNSGFIANYTESPPPNEYGTYVTTMNMMNSHSADNCTLHLDDVIKSQLTQQHDHHMQPERVKVQHLQTHTNLQNNRWNYHSFYNLNAETEKDLTKIHINNNTNFNNNNNNNSNNNNNNIPNESAFVKIYDMNDKNSIFISAGTEAYYNHCNNINNNNNNIRFVPNRIGVNNNTTTTAATTINNSNRKCTLVSDVFECALAIQQQQQQQQQQLRTEDQENAFRRIEDVHNYAKINPTNYSNGASSTSSINDDDDADDVESEDDDDNALDLDNKTYEHFYTNRLITSKTKKFEPNRISQTTKVANKRTAVVDVKIGAAEQAVEEMEDDDIETDVNVDIESIQLRAAAQSEAVECASSVVQRPNNHARRPMNAFLIFCKRHRAIVKERYKSLENRAITKILGDWWASLDANDKKCFTNLAQQNKDVFFSANPNFKWYKLPARPCRTLATRPTNVERSVIESELDNDNGNDAESFIRKARPDQVKARSDNYFKLADVAQMGELSALLSNDRNKVVHCELQQALGETTEFLNAHMPAHYQMGKINRSNHSSPATVKRKLHSDHSFSSNSSEDDAIPKKTSRTCKGKIYQELKNSGQITIVAKKSKNNQKSNSSILTQTEQSGDMLLQNVVVGPEYNNHMQPSSASSSSLVETCQSSVCTFLDDSAPHTDLMCSTRKRIVSETESLQSCDLANFDLEEKIKELPALNLELYLQRKRNTKKKKKFNTKKRNSNSISSNKSITSIASPTATQNNSPTTAAAAANKTPIPQSPTAQQQPAQAVGSQKRKARKESITRRDVSAIENEVASLIPLNTDFTTINGGRYYFDEETEEASSSSSPKMLMTTISMSPEIASGDAFAQVSTNIAAVANRDAAAISNLIYPHSSSNFVDNNLNDSNNISSTTSDLLILAEVAANRTGSIN